MNPIDTHLIKDTRKRTAKRNELHPATKLIILAVALTIISLVYYFSAVTDAIIGLMLI